MLRPIFESGFSESSFGVRPGRSARGALRRVQTYIAEGYHIAVDLGRGEILRQRSTRWLAGRKGRDKRLLALIGKSLRAGVLVGETLQATELGTLQGGLVSRWLGNILLDDLDQELERRGHRCVRYC